MWFVSLSCIQEFMFAGWLLGECYVFGLNWSCVVKCEKQMVLRYWSWSRGMSIFLQLSILFSCWHVPSVVLAFADFYCSRQSSGTVFRYRLFAEGSLDKAMMFMHRRKFSCMDMMLLCHFSSRSKKGKCLPSEFKYSLTADWAVH